MPWPPQVLHLAVESFKTLKKLNYFLQKLLSGKYTNIDSTRVSCLKLLFSQDLIYTIKHDKIIYKLYLTHQYHTKIWS